MRPTFYFNIKKYDCAGSISRAHKESKTRAIELLETSGDSATTWVWKGS